MLKLRSNKGFTLIELLVVVIIVAVLAAVGVPLLSANVARARASEAEAALGTMRTGLRSFFAERKTYVGATFPLIGINRTLGGANIADGDLDGRFFSDDAYSLQSLGITTFCINADGAGSLAPKKDQVQTTNLLVRSMDEQGNIRDALNCGGNILN